MYEQLFYNRLTRLRMEQGYSARDLSLKIGHNPGYINDLENQNGYPSMQAFFYICEELHITPSEFFDEGNKFPAKLQEIMDGLKKLNGKELETVAMMVKALQK